MPESLLWSEIPRSWKGCPWLAETLRWAVRAVACSVLRPFSIHCESRQHHDLCDDERNRGRTLASTTAHRSPTLEASISHISFLQATYSCARSSSFRASQSSTWRRSMSRSCRFRQALAVLLGKCLLAMGCQLRPDARACSSTSSSVGFQIAAFLEAEVDVVG